MNNPLLQLAGLVSYKDVRPEHVTPAVDHWLERLLACDPLSLRAIKQIVKRTEDLPRREARATRLPALVEVLTSEDVTEGTNAFKEKRALEWRGR